MARLLTQKDVYTIVNTMVEDLTGQQSTIRAVDTSTFVSVGEQILAQGTENILNELGLLVGRILVAARPYKGGRFNLINSIDTGIYTHRLLKISYFSNKALPSGAFNTDLYTNLKDGFTNGQNLDSNDQPQSTRSMWEQHMYEPMTLNFAGSSVWQECITIPEVQLQQAFRSEGEFNEFFSGIMIRHENDIELEKEAFRTALVLNQIGAIYDLRASMPGSVVNLTAAFNAFYSTSYTSAQLRSTYLKEFLAFMVFQIKNDIKKMQNESVKFHWSPASQSGGALLRHTPKDKQKLFLYEPLMLQAEANVLPEIFNEKYLSLDKNYEGIEFWQNEEDPSAVKVTPAIPDIDSTSATYGTQIAGSAVTLPYVVGLLFDEDAMMVDFQLERADSTPLEARKLYRNLWLTISKNLIGDLTEKQILYIMADPT